MAQFRAKIKGIRGPASRLGSKASGILSDTNGWRSGVRVVGHTDSKGEDQFDVSITTGSGTGYELKFLGSVRLIEGRPVWEPAE